MTATTPLTCDGFANALADYLERDDTPRVRAAVEAHAASCAECGALLADLQQVRVDAAGLPTLTPSRDLWDGIAQRIEAPVIDLGSRVGGRGSRYGRIAVWMRPMAAAAALVVITAGVTYVATRELLSDQQVVARVDSTAVDPRQAVASANDSARQATDAEKRFAVAERSTERSDARASRAAERAPGSSAPDPRPSTLGPAVLASANQPPVAATLEETVYGREIARLRRIIDQRRALLDTATVGVIERNLSIIDQAIRESRAALARDPGSVFLNGQLNNALEQKVELLRAAAVLPVRT